MKAQGLLPVLIMSTLVWLVPQAKAQAQLDYARIIKESGMVFIPQVGMNRGPIYYTQYEQVPTTTARVGSLRRIIVNLLPAAHRQNLYSSFVLRHGITDARVGPVPAAGECRPSEEIRRLLSGMPEGYRPRILPGGYPIICSLSVYFLPENEELVRQVIAQRPVIILRATVPLCSPQSPQISVPRIIQELSTQGVLRQQRNGAYTGNLWDVYYASAVLAHQNPGLFGGVDPRGGWATLAKEFVRSFEEETATVPFNNAQAPIYICVPEPLQLSFG